MESNPTAGYDTLEPDAVEVDDMDDIAFSKPVSKRRFAYFAPHGRVKVGAIVVQRSHERNRPPSFTQQPRLTCKTEAQPNLYD